MISLTGTTISLPQGDSGAVTFYFKDKQRDWPLIFKDTGNKWEMLFTVSDSSGGGSALRLRKKYEKSDVDTEYFRHFNNGTILEYPKDNSKLAVNTLYYKTTTLDNGEEAYEFVYWETDNYDEAYKRSYDYENSSLTVSFDYSDTELLEYRTYFYDIKYIERDANDNIVLQRTLLGPCQFVVTGTIR